MTPALFAAIYCYVTGVICLMAFDRSKLSLAEPMPLWTLCLYPLLAPIGTIWGLWVVACDVVDDVLARSRRR